MKKTVVIYKSSYGSTKKYAEWIAQELKCDLFDTNKVKDDMLVDYDIIIFGGGLYASGINRISLIKNSFSSLRDKDVIVFTVGLADPEKSDFTSLIDKNFTSEMKERIKLFHLRGSMDYHKLSFIHRTMMAMLKSMISRKPEKDLSEDDKGILQTYGQSVDFTKKENISPIVDYVMTAQNG